jgi:nucleoside-triphosphatase
LKKRLLLVTGAPGTGKTTVLLKTAEDLKRKGYSVGGMLSREVRSNGNRIGFEILNLNSGRKGWLASVHQKQGPQIGKYRVNLDDLNIIGVDAIVKAAENCDVVVVDEIGPMEFFSEQFREAVRKIAKGKKLAVCTIHWKMSDSLLESMRKREDAQIYVVTYENRGHLHEAMVLKALDFLAETRSRINGYNFEAKNSS